MVILEKTPTKLKLRHQPYWVWILASSLVLGFPFIVVLISLILTWVWYFWWLPWLFFLFSVFGILLLIVAGQVVTCTFDKSLDKVTIKRRGMLNKKVIEHSLAEILDIQVKSTSWNPDENANYQIVMILRYGSSVPLNLGQSSGWKEKLETANLIREFLGMPPQQFRL